MFNQLVGHKLVSIDIGDETKIVTDKGTFTLYHAQSCCESVHHDSTDGIVENLIGHVVTLAEDEITAGDDACRSGEKSATDSKFYIEAGGHRLEIVYHGESNGYYEEEMSVRYKAHKQ